MGAAGEDGLEDAELFDGVDELVFGVVEGLGRVVLVVGSGVFGGQDEVAGVRVGELEVAGLSVVAHTCDGRGFGRERGVSGFAEGRIGRIRREEWGT